MNLVTLEGVAKQFSERVLLDGVDLRINSGDRIGLIGLNGSGKSTLLRIVAGIEAADAGKVTVWGGVRIHYLPQAPPLADDRSVLDQLFDADVASMRRLRDYTETMFRLEGSPADAKLQARLSHLVAEMDRSSGWAAEANAKAVLTRLGITDFDALAGTLSGGERKRVALARALIDPADLLILDEPTNHIDADTLAWLEEHLARIPSALLMVTHDRYFLDRVVNRIVELDRRTLVSFPGSYARYLEQSAERHDRLTKSEEDRQRHLRRELEWLRRGAKARSTKQKARIQRVGELQKLQYDSREERVSIALATTRLGAKVLTATGLAKAYEGRPVLGGVDLMLAPGDRVGIIGPNGAGKSTLLDVLAGRTAPDAGTVTWGDTVRLGYFDQQSTALAPGKRVIEVIEAEAPLIHTRDGERVAAWQMLEWFLFTRPAQHTLVESLSGGERRRLDLLRVLLHQPNVLFLDEPTNDLDIETLEVLEEFLDHFTGVLVVVSHDRYFLDRTVDQLRVLSDGALSVGYPAPFETYRRLRDEEAARIALSSAPGGRKGASGDDRTGTAGAGAAVAAGQPADAADGDRRRADAPPKRSWKEQRELEVLEMEIAALEARQSALAGEINAAGGDYVRIEALSGEIDQVGAALDVAMARWLVLGDGA